MGFVLCNMWINTGATSLAKAAMNEELIELFKTECHDRASQIDPDNSQDWKSLTLGWAIAKGLSPDDAWDFALHIRYKTELG
jgi:hypothetical protein